MKYKLFITYDRQAQSIAGPIFMFPREAPAIRLFHDTLGEAGNPMSKHPDDYELFEIGTIDEETAEIMPRTEEIDGKTHALRPERIASGKDWKNSQPEKK